jgi:hypothetical protein
MAAASALHAELKSRRKTRAPFGVICFSATSEFRWRLAPFAFAIVSKANAGRIEREGTLCRKSECSVAWQQSCLPTWSAIAGLLVKTR